jgi:RNA 3'-terminal phosphate cyclase
MFGGDCSDAVLGSTTFHYCPVPVSAAVAVAVGGQKMTVHDNDSDSVGDSVGDSVSGIAGGELKRKKLDERPRRYVEDVGSAGSLTLVLQALLPCVVMRSIDFCEPTTDTATGDTDITLIGGTNVSFSPPVEHFLRVLLPLLSNMGILVTARLVRRGFFPRGGGKIHLTKAATSASGMTPLSLTHQGSFKSAQIYVYVSVEENDMDTIGPDAYGILQEAVDTLRSNLNDLVMNLLSKTGNVDESFRIGFDSVCCTDDCKKNEDQKSESRPIGAQTENNINRGGNKNGNKYNNKKKSNKVAITLGALVCIHTTTGCVISADAMVNERDHRKLNAGKSLMMTGEIINTIMTRLERTIVNGACVDEQTADQLLIYMALCPGMSEILCAPLCPEDHSQHIGAAIDIISQFTNRQFTVEVHPETHNRLIRCL